MAELAELAELPSPWIGAGFDGPPHLRIGKDNYKWATSRFKFAIKWAIIGKDNYKFEFSHRGLYEIAMFELAAKYFGVESPTFRQSNLPI